MKQFKTKLIPLFFLLLATLISNAQDPNRFKRTG